MVVYDAFIKLHALQAILQVLHGSFVVMLAACQTTTFAAPSP